MRAVHRWIGLLIGLQLLASAAGGLFWATRDHKTNHGLTRRKGPAVEPIPLAGLVSAEAAVRAISPAGDVALEKARLYRRAGKPAWEVKVPGADPAYIDAATGAPLGLVTEEEAKAMVQADYTGGGTVAGARMIERDADRPLEIRNRPLPQWRVELDDEWGTRFYVDAKTGEVGNNVFTDAEEWWDVFWGLHIMAPRTRTLTRNWPLAAFAAAVLALTLTGLSLWVPRIRAKLAPGAPPT